MEKQPPKVKSQSESVFENELAKFCQIFPQFVSEGKIDFVAFQKFLQQNKAEINNQDRYNFSWAGKMQSFHAIQQPCFAWNPQSRFTKSHGAGASSSFCS